MTHNLQHLLEQAARSSGEESIALERQLRAAGPELVQLLESEPYSPDPVRQLLRQVLLDATRGAENEHRAADAYLSHVESYFAGTAAPVPPPIGVANYLARHFRDRVAELVTLRLVKGRGWPFWRSMAVLLYLQRVRDRPLLTAPLIRFATFTHDPELVAAAVKTLLRIGDPRLKRRLVEERRRARFWPAALEALQLGTPARLR